MTRVPHRLHRLVPAGDPVRLLQMTDTHLGEQPGSCLLGMDTDRSLQAVLAQALAAHPSVDALLATGDLADHGSLPAYQRLRQYFDATGIPHFWLPGNHDDRALMAAVDQDGSLLVNDLRLGRWQIILLDSQVPGEIGGELGAAQLALLRTALEAGSREGLHALVCLHHHPVAIGCDWLDEQQVSDADALFALLAEFPLARALLWGHVHQPLDREFRSLRLLATPSTCVQFAPGSRDFRADDLPPGYRWLHLYDDGRLETGVERVRGVHFEVNLEQKGYL